MSTMIQQGEVRRYDKGQLVPWWLAFVLPVFRRRKRWVWPSFAWPVFGRDVTVILDEWGRFHLFPEGDGDCAILVRGNNLRIWFCVGQHSQIFLHVETARAKEPQA